MKQWVMIAACSVALVGCVSRNDVAVEGDAGARQETARAVLRDARGQAVGNAELSQESGGVRVRLAATAMPAGTYGSHVHMVGRCDAPEFTTAGEHWNPTGARHGRDNPDGPHLGDLPNLSVSANGRGSIEYLVTGATIAGTGASMIDADGSALLIHAAADDYRTDPSGKSGARIACGIVR